MRVMRAITLWQPWASLIAIGSKPYETRSWAPPAALIGQRIAIHAAARPCDTDMMWHVANAVTTAIGGGWPRWLPRGAVVCTAVLAGAYRLEEPAYDEDELTVVEAVSGSNPAAEIFADLFGDYSPGRWAWLLTGVQPVDPPPPAKGRQGWWEWTP